MNPAALEKQLKKARDLVKSEHFLQALKLYAALAERFPDYYGEYGSAAAQSGDFELANRLWEKFQSRAGNNGTALDWLGGQCEKIGFTAKSRSLWCEAARLEPGNLELQIKVASLLTHTNQVEEARSAIKRCLELDPQNEQVRYFSANLDRRENKIAEAECQVRELLASGLTVPRGRYSCLAELAYILDRTERFDEAMSTLEEGKRLARRTMNLTEERKSFYREHENEVRQTKAFPNDILETWSKTFPPSARNAVSPVSFLTGSARSGTTLLERVLDAHPSVAACDETLAFNKIQSRIDLAAPAIPAQRLNVLRELYVKNMATISGVSAIGKTLLDKNPSRTAWLPAFLRLFPELRVLIALRDPRDVMISLYFQNQPYTNYQTLEQHARHYASLMDAWLAVREWGGLNWMETRYEDVVADLEKEGARVTKFLGLQWHENQARFFEHNREKPIMSNNAADVTRPVYKRAVGRWRVYEKHLASVLPLLEPYCRKFGYE